MRLNNGSVSLDKVELPDARSDIAIESVVPGDDLIVIANRGSEKIDLSDWYLISSRGGEWYVFPKDTSLAPNGTLTIGTNSSDAPTDLIWDDKKVVHKSKTDVITLYDASGAVVSEMSNGL